MSNTNKNTINKEVAQQVEKTTLNLRIFNQGRSVPETAQKEIEGGNLKGFTDINPVWRIEKLTEIFGPCGEGWYYEKIKEETKEVPNGSVLYFVDINLFYKMDNGEWSKGIFGTGGSTLVTTKTTNSGVFFYLDDDGKKKALTDAISVACKSLGIAADIYYAKDVTKYGELADFAPVQLPTPTVPNQSGNTPTMVQQMNDITDDNNPVVFNTAQNAVGDAIVVAQQQTTAKANPQTDSKTIYIDPATTPVPTVQEAEGYMLEGNGKYKGKTVGELIRLVGSGDASAQGWLNWLLTSPMQTENMAKAQFYANFLMNYYQQNAGQNA